MIYPEKRYESCWIKIPSMMMIDCLAMYNTLFVLKTKELTMYDDGIAWLCIVLEKRGNKLISCKHFFFLKTGKQTKIDK